MSTKSRKRKQNRIICVAKKRLNISKYRSIRFKYIAVQVFLKTLQEAIQSMPMFKIINY